MSRESLPVIAAVPNYNMANELSTLLPQLLEQEYDRVYVLDDSSSDRSRELIEETDGVDFIGGLENLGAGANRNRILGQLGTRSIIHFIDADMDIETENGPDVIRDIVPDVPFGFIGGLIKDLQGEQHPFNYGPQQCLRTMLSANLHMHIMRVAEKDVDKAIELRNRFSGFLEDWPNTFEEPTERDVFWNAESNLVVNSDVFEALEGFDPRLREHEIQDFAMRLADRGLHGRFDPALSAVHTEGDVRPSGRGLQMAKAELLIARTHGLRNWVMPNGSFKPELAARQ